MKNTTSRSTKSKPVRRGRPKGSVCNVRISIKELLPVIGERGFVILNARFADFIGVKGTPISGQNLFKS